jgi:hypothetical protein
MPERDELFSIDSGFTPLFQSNDGPNWDQLLALGHVDDTHAVEAEKQKRRDDETLSRIDRIYAKSVHKSEAKAPPPIQLVIELGEKATSQSLDA